ncbi:hypothetical protein AWV79_13920 [Cupriavidus sp. UYMMa02A]|nr:hypothetical protein AWV79_13920 [Cupriavidus sp. UYMMa02A]
MDAGRDGQALAGKAPELALFAPETQQRTFAEAQEAGPYAVADGDAGLGMPITRGPSSSVASTSVYGASARNASSGARLISVTAWTVASPPASRQRSCRPPQARQAWRSSGCQAPQSSQHW